MSLRCYFLVALTVLVCVSPADGINMHSTKLSLKIILQKKNIASSERRIGEMIQKLLNDTGADLVLTRKRKRLFDIYFDTPDLFFLKHNGYIFYQAEEYFTKKKKKKKYHERVVYNAGSSETLEFKVRHYSSIQTGEGKHPLFSLVKRKQRPNLLADLKQDGIKYPLRLKSIFQVAENRESFVLSGGGQELLSIHSSFLTGRRFKSEASFGLITVDTSKDFLGRISTVQQKYIRNFLVELEHNGTRVVPEEKKYRIIFKQMEKKIMFFPLLLHYPSIVNFLYAGTIGCIGLLLIKLFFYFTRNERDRPASR